MRGIHRRPVNSPHKGPVTRKMFSFDDVIMALLPYKSIYKLSLPAEHCCNIRHLSETHPKLTLTKFRPTRTSILLSNRFEIYTEHGNCTAVLCAKFQNVFVNWAISYRARHLFFPQLGSRKTIKQYGLVRNRDLLGHDNDILPFSI